MSSLSEETKGRVGCLDPGSVIGIVGGGHLGRMMALSVPLPRIQDRCAGLHPRCSCGLSAQVADFQEMVDYGDLDALKRPADRNDELIYEFENLDANALDQARDRMGIFSPPPPRGPTCLRVTQDRILSETLVSRHGIDAAPWAG